MSLTPEGTSPVLLQNLKHNKILHEKVVLLSILPADVPTVPASERVKVEDLGRASIGSWPTTALCKGPMCRRS